MVTLSQVAGNLTSVRTELRIADISRIATKFCFFFQTVSVLKMKLLQYICVAVLVLLPIFEAAEGTKKMTVLMLQNGETSPRAVGLPPNATVGHLRRASCQQAEGTAARIFFRGTELRDDAVFLSDHGVGPWAEVNVDRVVNIAVDVKIGFVSQSQLPSLQCTESLQFTEMRRWRLNVSGSTFKEFVVDLRSQTKKCCVRDRADGISAHDALDLSMDSDDIDACAQRRVYFGDLLDLLHSHGLTRGHGATMEDINRILRVENVVDYISAGFLGQRERQRGRVVKARIVALRH